MLGCTTVLRVSDPNLYFFVVASPRALVSRGAAVSTRGDSAIVRLALRRRCVALVLVATTGRALIYVAARWRAIAKTVLPPGCWSPIGRALSRRRTSSCQRIRIFRGPTAAVAADSMTPFTALIRRR